MRNIVMSLVVLAVLLVAIPVFAGTGDEAFNGKCAVCHAKDGSGDTVMGKKLGAKDMRDPATLTKTDAEYEAVIANGIPEKKMPAFKDKLTADVIKDVVAYIRTFKK